MDNFGESGKTYFARIAQKCQNHFIYVKITDQKISENLLIVFTLNLKKFT